MVTGTQLLKGLHVLVVDDYPEMASLVGEILSDEGAFVVPANSGASAIALTMLMHFDMLVLDLRMPQPDGIKIIEFLKATNPGLLRRTVVLTGMSFDPNAMGLVDRLHIPCISKPFQVSDLVAVAARIALPGNPSIPAA